MPRSPGLSASHPAAVDALRAPDAKLAAQALSIAAFALVTAAGAQIRLQVWEVPFTLQTVGVYASGLYLGWRNGAASQALYLALGLLIPVYAGGGHGVAYLAGSVSAGYLLAFPLGAAVAGALSRRWNGPTGAVLSVLASSVVVFSIGVVWLHFAAGHATWADSIDRGWLRFVPVDAAKVLLVSIVYSGTRRIR